MTPAPTAAGLQSTACAQQLRSSPSGGSSLPRRSRRRSSSPASFPSPGQIGLFIAAADGSDERPLLDRARRRLRPGVVAGRRVDRLHLGARRLGRSVPRQAGRHRPRAADRRSRRTTIRRRSLPTASSWSSSARAAAASAHLWTMDLQTRRAKALTSGRRRRLPAVVVARRPVDRVLVRSRQHDAVRARPLGAPAARRSLRRSTRTAPG